MGFVVIFNSLRLESGHYHLKWYRIASYQYMGCHCEDSLFYFFTMKFPYLTRRSSYWDGARGFLCKLQVRFTMVIMHHIGESLMWATGRMAAVILVTSRCQAISNHHADSTAALLSRFSHYNLHHTYFVIMMTSSNWNIFRVTGPLWGESTGHRWLPLTKAIDAELWCFLWSAPE